MADRSVLVRLRADVSDFVAKSQLAKAAVRDLHNEIDKSNDRTAWLAQGILALVPAVTRLGAGAVPVLSGIATQLTIGVAAAGTALIAFNGIGDALGALNDYQLAPTEANLAKLNETMAKIGPDGQAFVEFLDSLGPAFTEIANSARGGLFPGVVEGIEDFMDLAPQLNEIVREIGEGMGELTADAGAGLSGPRFEKFFDYLEKRAKPILIEMGQTLGNFVIGLTNMLVAFDPLTDDFSKGLLEMSRSFATWSEGLSASSGFQDFVDYVREAGPQALDFLGSFIMALVELAEAAAPVGAVMLPVLTGMLDLLGDLANTPLGPIALGFLALTSAWGRLNAVAELTGSGIMAKATAGLRANVTEARAAIPTYRQLGNAMAFAATPTSALVKSSWSYSQAANSSAINALKARTAVQNFGRSVAPVAGQVGLLALAMSDVDDRMGLTNTTSLLLAGSLLGPWGAAVGGAAGLMLDMKAASDEASKGFRGLDQAVDTKNIEALTQRIAEAKAEMADQENITGFGDFFSDTMRDLFIGGAGSDVMKIYADEIDKAEAELADLKNARQEAAADKSFYNSIEAETAALEANIQAMREKREEALRGLNAELDYKASILDARDALKDNGKTVDENTRAGQANLRALYGLAAAWNQQDDATKNAAGSLRNARTNFINTAEAMGMGEDKAKRLAKALFEIPTSRKTQIQVDADLAFQRLRAFKASIDSIDRNIVVGVSIQRGSSDGLAYLSGGARQRDAGGGTVAGQRFPYGDKVTVDLAPGEEVVSNRYGQADNNRYALKAANAGAKLAVIGYANGGTIGGPGRPTVTSFDPLPNRGEISRRSWEMLLVAAETQLEAATKLDEAAKSQVEATRSRMADVANSTASRFNTGLFEPDSNPWLAGRGGTLGALDKDIAGLTERQGIQDQLRALGLTEDAAAELLKQGSNSDINAMIQRGEIAQYADKFNRRAALQDSVGTDAGDLAFGDILRSQLGEAGRTTASVDRLGGLVENLTNKLEELDSRADKRAMTAAEIISEGIAGPVRRSSAARSNGKPVKPS